MGTQLGYPTFSSDPLRSTLIFKNIPENPAEKNWSDTTNTLVSLLSSLFNWNPTNLSNDIERAHRGKEDDNHKRGTNKPRPIYVKFHSWKSSENVRKSVVDANRQGRTNVIVSQMYSKKTTETMNEKLKLRKEIMRKEKNWKMFVKYPGVLYVKKPNENKFILFEDNKPAALM